MFLTQIITTKTSTNVEENALCNTYGCEVRAYVYGLRAVDDGHEVDEARHGLEGGHCFLDVVRVDAGQTQVEQWQQVTAAVGEAAVIAQHRTSHGCQAVQAGNQTVWFC